MCGGERCPVGHGVLVEVGQCVRVQVKPQEVPHKLHTH